MAYYVGDTLYAWTDSNPSGETLYTNSTTLTTGMTLYDNTGTDTGHKVGVISGNSFDIQTETVTTYYAWIYTKVSLRPNAAVSYPNGRAIVYSETESIEDWDIVYASPTTIKYAYETHDDYFNSLQNADYSDPNGMNPEPAEPLVKYARASEYDCADLENATFHVDA